MKTARELAQEIADDLFTNSRHEKAERLVLDLAPMNCASYTTMENHQIKSGGGWCYEAAVTAIEAKLAENLFWKLS